MYKSGILDEFKLTRAEDIFSIGFFLKSPKPYYELCRRRFVDTFVPHPTQAHWFLRALHDAGVLQRIYTQNIDNLEIGTYAPLRTSLL